MFPDWRKRSNPKSNSEAVAGSTGSDIKDQNHLGLSDQPSVDVNHGSDPCVETEVKPDLNPDPKCGSEGDVVELPVMEKIPDPSLGDLGEESNTVISPTTNEPGESVVDVVTTEADEVVDVEAVDDGETDQHASTDDPQKPPVVDDVEKNDTEAGEDTRVAFGSREALESKAMVEQVGPSEGIPTAMGGMSHPQLASLSTTLESSIFTSSIVSTQPRERHPSLPGPALLPPASPSSPMEPPVLPFTAFSLPTSPSHSASFSPITPAPSILHPPAPPLATPRPQMAPPGPAPLPPLLSSSSLQHAPSAAFSLPTLPPAPSNILPPSSPSKDEDGVETV